MALIWRLHHCLADGTTCMRIGASLLWDTSPEIADPAPNGWAPAPAPGALDLLARGLADQARRRAQGLSPFARRTPRPPRVPVRRRVVSRELSPTAARTPLARRVSARRAVAFAPVPLGPAHAAGKAIDSAITLNDVVLAVIAGGMRAWLGRGYGPSGGIRVKIPVSLHEPGRGRPMSATATRTSSSTSRWPRPTSRAGADDQPRDGASASSITTPTCSTGSGPIRSSSAGR